ncbi:hypothetical protein FK765_16805 [Escherichia coli]|nr:hypothetical protein [Escherichia coli]
MLHRGRENSTPAILTAAPFRGLPQPEAHGRRNLTTSLLREKHHLRALSCCAPVFFYHFRLGGILEFSHNQ